MIKQDLVDRLANTTTLTASQSEHAVNGMIEILRAMFIAGESVTIKGFGRIEVKQRASKVARDIKKGTPVTLPATNIVRFKPCPQLKKQMQKK